MIASVKLWISHHVWLINSLRHGILNAIAPTSPAFYNDLKQALQRDGVECIVAPYEADAQLAYLSRTGYVHAVISEDSDLLPFGCTRVC